MKFLSHVRHIAVCSIALLSLVALTACGGGQSVVGNWVSLDKHPDFISSVQFKPDGSVILGSIPAYSNPMTMMASSSIRQQLLKERFDTGSYKVLDGKHVRLVQGGEGVELGYEIDGNQLTLTQDAMGSSVSHVFVRR